MMLQTRAYVCASPRAKHRILIVVLKGPKMSNRVLSDVVLLGAICVSAALSFGGCTPQEARTVSLFDGRTFDGWEGNLDHFRIQDGAIVGGSLEEALPRNEFLCTEKVYRDFELSLQVKLVGDPATANAGIQIRSRRIPNNNDMSGYQADMGQHFWACLYDEGRRHRILAKPDPQRLHQVLKPNDWNEYVIRCVGPRVQLWMNGYQTVDYTEPDESLEQAGVIGLQIHSGPPTEAWYKDIKITVIPEAR
jgi:hypothetical protein